jgi:hypothetical protein
VLRINHVKFPYIRGLATSSAVPAVNPVHSPSMSENSEQDKWIDEVLGRLGEKRAQSKGNEAGSKKR